MCSSMDFMESAAREASCFALILRLVSFETSDLVGEIVSVTTLHPSLNHWPQGLMARVR